MEAKLAIRVIAALNCQGALADRFMLLEGLHGAGRLAESNAGVLEGCDLRVQGVSIGTMHVPLRYG